MNILIDTQILIWSFDANSLIPDIKEVADQLISNGFELLRLTNEHIFAYQNLPLFQEHRDPFDRFLIAIAKQENFNILTTDSKFQLYSSFIETIFLLFKRKNVVNYNVFMFRICCYSQHYLFF
jgi:PIN domain nuclease of toxin-antitoxin system